VAEKLRLVPIPDMTKLHRLQENLGTVNVELTSQDLFWASDDGVSKGHRSRTPAVADSSSIP
jgi:aryl-alcohol dehydrogenase-like predicted oxidoreductase